MRLFHAFPVNWKGVPVRAIAASWAFMLTFLKDGFEQYFASRPDVFVAGDLLWYPVLGHPEIAAAPDVFMAINRPKGSRRCYKQWEEGGIAPQVVFEILSDSNTGSEMMKKMDFYSRHAVQEYVVFDPAEPQLQVWVRDHRGLASVPDPQGWTSSALGATFWLTADSALEVVFPDGTRMLSHAGQAERADAEKQRAEAEKHRAELEKERADRLAEKLRALGVDPDAP